MNCSNCGNQVDEGERSCQQCGTSTDAILLGPAKQSGSARTRILIGVSLCLGVLALLVIIGFVITGVGLGFAQTGSSSEYVPGVGVKHEIMPARNHVGEGQAVEYNSIPPTSGDHWPRWSQCGFFEEALPDERIVHNLEHSNIVVSYNLATPEEVKQLKDVMGRIDLAGRTGVSRFYEKIPEGTVALAAWGVSDIMKGIDEERINTFFDHYAGTLGPEGNIPCVNSGVRP